MAISGIENSNLDNIRLLTANLTDNFESEIDIGGGGGLIFTCLTSFFDKLSNVAISIVRDDKIVLYLNKFAKQQITKSGFNPYEFIGEKCIGERIGWECPAKDKCTKNKIWSAGRRAVLFRDIKGPCSDESYTLLLLPLKFDGVRAIVELWFKQDN